MSYLISGGESAVSIVREELNDCHLPPSFEIFGSDFMAHIKSLWGGYWQSIVFLSGLESLGVSGYVQYFWERQQFFVCLSFGSKRQRGTGFANLKPDSISLIIFEVERMSVAGRLSASEFNKNLPKEQQSLFSPPFAIQHVNTTHLSLLWARACFSRPRGVRRAGSCRDGAGKGAEFGSEVVRKRERLCLHALPVLFSIFSTPSSHFAVLS